MVNLFQKTSFFVFWYNIYFLEVSQIDTCLYPFYSEFDADSEYAFGKQILTLKKKTKIYNFLKIFLF